MRCARKIAPPSRARPVIAAAGFFMPIQYRKCWTHDSETTALRGGIPDRPQPDPRGARVEITREKVRRELGLIAFSSIGDYFHWGPEGVILKDKTMLTPEQQAAVAEVSRSRTRTGETIRVKLHDKLAALDKLAGHLGMYREPPEPEEYAEHRELTDTERVQRVLALVGIARLNRS